MRLHTRMATAAVLAVLAAATLAGTISAAPPERGCPNGTEEWMLVDQQGWWDETVDGFAIAGIQVYVNDDPGQGFTAEFDAFMSSFGFAGGQGLYDFVWGPQWDHLNHNGDAFVCMKPRPVTPGGGNPGFFFNGRDNSVV